MIVLVAVCWFVLCSGAVRGQDLACWQPVFSLPAERHGRIFYLFSRFIDVFGKSVDLPYSHEFILKNAPYV